MAILLQTKPGINGANTLSIPKDWDSTWFRKFIANSLKGADVRNAVGAGGIVVSGNISSPYATIGFAAPVTLPGPVTINSSPGAISLTVNGASGQLTAVFNSFDGSTDTIALNAPSGRFTSILLRNAGAFKAQLFWDNTNSLIYLGTSSISASGIEITGAGAILGHGPVAGGAVDMTPDTGTFTLTGTGFTAGVTSTATWYRIGRLVALNVGNGMQGTSNATTFTMTGLPAALQPSSIGAGSQTQVCADLTNNGVAVFGNAAISNGSGTISMGNGPNAGAAWTNAGVKGFFDSGGSTIFYML